MGKRARVCMLVVIVLAGFSFFLHSERSFVTAGEEPENFLKNPSFEEGETGKIPPNWGLKGTESTFVTEEGGRTPDSKGMGVLVQSPNDSDIYISGTKSSY